MTPARFAAAALRRGRVAELARSTRWNQVGAGCRRAMHALGTVWWEGRMVRGEHLLLRNLLDLL